MRHPQPSTNMGDIRYRGETRDHLVSEHEHGPLREGAHDRVAHEHDKAQLLRRARCCGCSSTPGQGEGQAASGPGCGLGVRGLGLGAGVVASRAFSVHR